MISSPSMRGEASRLGFSFASRPSCVPLTRKHLAVRNLCVLCLGSVGGSGRPKTECDRNCLCVLLCGALRHSSLSRERGGRPKQLLFCFPLFNCSRCAGRSQPEGLHWHGQYTP